MNPLSLVFYFIIIVPSSIIHEYMHGWVANQLGDPTAKYAGRLSLDPRVHIDLWGTIIMPIVLFVFSGGSFMFAYAKPVPFNPYNLRHGKWGPAIVGAAGPLANLAVAAVFGSFIRFFPYAAVSSMLAIIVYSNVMLAIFNLVPIPPLDGSKILYALLPPSMDNVRAFLDRYGFFILLFFIFYAFQVISPIIQWVFTLLVGGRVMF